jgi:uncharacterized membrane protein
MIELFVRDKPGRIQLIDGLRGLSILLMIGYHFGYDLVLFLGVPTWLIFNPILDFLQPFFAGEFIFLSGVSSRFSRNNLKRGLLMLAAAAAITLVTYFIGLPVWFGIIHFLGAAAILFAFLRPAVDKISRPVQLIMYIALYVCAIQFTGRVYDINWLWWLGFRSAGFSSADYFPILPWIFIYLTGTLAGTYIVEKRLPEKFYTFRVPFFAAAGRNTMLIYLVHQPVLYVVTLIVRAVMNSLA